MFLIYSEKINFKCFIYLFQLCPVSTASQRPSAFSSARRPSSSAAWRPHLRPSSSGWRTSSLWWSITGWRSCPQAFSRSPTWGCRIAASTGATFQTKTPADWAKLPSWKSISIQVCDILYNIYIFKGMKSHLIKRYFVLMNWMNGITYFCK